MRQVTWLSVAVVVVLAGCTNDSIEPGPHRLDALIVDGAHSDGNPNFFFLPPLVPSPVTHPHFEAGRFNAALAPMVEVCELDAVDVLSLLTADCKSSTRVFGPARMALDGASEQYHINWDTQVSVLNPASFYRIIVRGASQGTILGVLDVDPVSGGMKNAKTGDVLIFQDGRTLPIKVRIEQGAFGSNANDNVEQVVPNVLPDAGLDVTTNTGFAGAHFSNGWLPEVDGVQLEQVVVIIERIDVNNRGLETSCLRIGLEELEGCYRFRTDPDLHGLGPSGTDLFFAIPVIAGVCFEFPDDVEQENDHPFALHRREEIRGVPTGPAEELEEVTAPFLRCGGFGPTPPSIGAAWRSGRVGEIAKAGWSAVSRALARVIQPTPLYAVDLGAGGSTNEFSRFGFARRATMTVTNGNGAVAPAGSSVPAAVKLENLHHDETSAIVGQAVTFTVTGGGGTLSATEDEATVCDEVSTCTVTSDELGNGGVSWRLGVGANTVEITTTQVINSPQTITATGTAGNLVISNFTQSFTNPTVADDIEFTAVVQNVGTTPVPASSMTLRVGGETFPPVTPVPALQPQQTFTVNRTVNLDVAQGYIAEAKADVNNAVLETNETDNNQLISFVVTALQTSIADASGDATAAAGVEIAPDLTSATAMVDRGNLTLQLRFAPGTFDQNATMAAVIIDVDQVVATGFSGVDAAHNDGALIGHEYLLEVGSQSVGTTATLRTFVPATGGFSSQKVGEITYLADGADVVVPLSALGGDRGELNFKVVVQTQISFPPDAVAYTGIVDYMTNLGSLPGSLVAHPPVIGWLPRNDELPIGSMPN